jgi:ribosomal protein S27AE
MEKLKQLIKESFELFVKKRWLKEIDRALKNYNKFSDRASREHYIMLALIKKYNELYPADPLRIKTAEQTKSANKSMAKAKWQFWEGWMSNHDMRIDDATCSNCGYKHYAVRRTPYSNETEQDVLNKLSNFCPNCGKPMDKNNN